MARRRRVDTFIIIFTSVALGSVGCANVTDRDTDPFNPILHADIPPPGTLPLRRGPSPHRGRIAEGLTLAEAQRIALEANPGLAANADAVDATKARIREAQVFTNPVLTFGKGEVPMKAEPMTSDTQSRVGAYDLRASNTFVSLSKDFDVSGKRVARVDGAIENERQSEAQYASAALSLSAQVRVGYASILVAERNLSLAREARELADKNKEVVANRALWNGLRSDTLRSEADAQRALSDLEQAERDLARAKLAFAGLLGDPEATVGPLRDELPLSRLPEDADGERLASFALENNADAIAARRALLSARANHRLQERSVIPDLTGQLTYNRYVLDKIDTFGIQLGLPLPIFDQNRGQIAEAQALVRQAEHQLSSTELSIVQQLRDDLRVLATSRSRIARFEKEIIPRDEEAAKLVRDGFEHGKVLFLDVSAALAALNQARSDYVSELSNHETALADLERLLGKPVSAVLGRDR